MPLATARACAALWREASTSRCDSQRLQRGVVTPGGAQVGGGCLALGGRLGGKRARRKRPGGRFTRRQRLLPVPLQLGNVSQLALGQGTCLHITGQLAAI